MRRAWGTGGGWGVEGVFVICGEGEARASVYNDESVVALFEGWFISWEVEHLGSHFGRHKLVFCVFVYDWINKLCDRTTFHQEHPS